jgi:hypothetical protein
LLKFPLFEDQRGGAGGEFMRLAEVKVEVEVEVKVEVDSL